MEAAGANWTMTLGELLETVGAVEALDSVSEIADSDVCALADSQW